MNYEHFKENVADLYFIRFENEFSQIEKHYLAQFKKYTQIPRHFFRSFTYCTSHLFGQIHAEDVDYLRKKRFFRRDIPGGWILYNLYGSRIIIVTLHFNDAWVRDIYIIKDWPRIMSLLEFV